MLADYCSEGAQVSCHALGVRLRDGAGIGGDRAQALAKFEKACGMGYGESCVEASLLLTTPGLANDPRRAAMLRDRACTVETRLCKAAEGSAAGGVP